jgi:two-component system sensor histidine kinase KdpD
MQSAGLNIEGTSVLISGEWKSIAATSCVASATNVAELPKAGEELRTTLLESIAHDLRSPLTAIRAAAGTLRRQSKLTKAARDEMIAVVEEESLRLDRLIGQTLKIAQLLPGAVRVNAQPDNLLKLIDVVLEEARSCLRRHSVRIDVSDTLPFVPMDRELVGRVLRHLLENAARYSPTGSPIVISGRIEDDRLVVTIADEGPGIDAADKPLIFEKCFRGGNQLSETQGTGMGLAVTRAILGAHGGGIQVVNSSSHGAVFTFWIPTTPLTAAN